MRVLHLESFVLLISLASCTTPASDTSASDAARATEGEAPRVAYRLSYDPSERDPVWRVELCASGLAHASGLWLELENWGEWLRLDGYYLRALRSDPPLQRREEHNRFDVEAPAEWDGELRLSYELALAELGSPARESFGLLPYRAPSYAFGFAANVLLSLRWEDRPAELERWIEIVGPTGWTIATGFGPPARGRLAARIEARIENTVISLGEPVASASDARGAAPIDVVQWGGERDVAAPLLAFARAYLDGCTRALGVPPSGALRLIVTEPGAGGTRTDGAIAVGCPDGFDGDANAYTLHFLAHELFHDWLGGRLKSSEGERLCWFWEGFTEYLSLWHLTSAGLVSRAWFAQRLGDCLQTLEENDHWGKLAFADPEVDWRDPSIEPLAYQGSALLAFALDVALRQTGKPGLDELVRGLLSGEGGRYSRDSIRAWLVAQGFEAFWQKRFASPGRLSPRADLIAVGYQEALEPAPLAYVGLRLDRDGPFGTVVAVDAAGPSAGLVFVGDRVSGLTPTHEPTSGAEAAAPDFPFGLAYYEPEAEEVRVDLERADGHHQVWVRPRRIPGPPRAMLVPGPALDAFFR